MPKPTKPSFPITFAHDRARLTRTLGSSAARFSGEVRALVACPDSRLLVAHGQHPPALLDSNTGEELARLVGHSYDSTYSLAVSPDGRLAASGGADKQVVLWNLASRRVVARLTAKPLVKALAFSPDSRTLLVGDDRTPKLFDASGKQIGALKGHQSQINAVAFSPDGELAVTAAGDRKVKLHVLTNQKTLLTLSGYPESLAFSPDSRRLYLAGWDRCACFDLKTADDATDFQPPPGKLLALSPDGRRLAVADDTQIAVVDTSGEGRRCTLPLTQTAVLAFSADGALLFAATRGTSLGHGTALRRFDAASGEERPFGDGHLGAVTDVALAGKKAVVSGSADGTGRLWTTGRKTTSVELPVGGAIDCAAANQEGTLAAFGLLGSAEVQVFDLATHRLVHTLHPASRSVALAFSPDGTVLAASANRQVDLFDVASGRLLRSLQSHRYQLLDLDFSSDGTQLLTAAADERVKVWDTASGDLLAELVTSGWPHALCALPGGRALVATSSLSVWDLATRTVIQPLRLEPGQPMALCASQSGRLAAVAQRHHDGAVTVLDLDTGKVLERIALAGDWPRALAMTPDGKRLLVGTDRGLVLELALELRSR